MQHRFLHSGSSAYPDLPSNRKEKPRSGTSKSCEETPKSAKMASTCFNSIIAKEISNVSEIVTDKKKPVIFNRIPGSIFILVEGKKPSRLSFLEYQS